MTWFLVLVFMSGDPRAAWRGDDTVVQRTIGKFYEMDDCRHAQEIEKKYHPTQIYICMKGEP